MNVSTCNVDTNNNDLLEVLNRGTFRIRHVQYLFGRYKGVKICLYLGIPEIGRASCRERV